MSERRQSRRDGISALEVLIAAVIATTLGFAIVVLLFQGSREATVSEDYMLAEALAQRHLAEAMSIPWADLEKRLPFENPIQGVPEKDARIAEFYEEYARNLEGPLAPKGQLTARELETGLVVFEVSLSWPTGPGSDLRRRYSLLRMRSRKDLSLSSRHPLLLPPREREGSP